MKLNLLLLVITTIAWPARAAKVDAKEMKTYYNACVKQASEAKAQGLGPKNVDGPDLCACLQAVHEDGVRNMSAPRARAHMAAAIALRKATVGSEEQKQVIREFQDLWEAELGAIEGCDQK